MEKRALIVQAERVGERALIARAAGGDLAAFAELARRYREMAFGYALAALRDFHLAEDVTQEALLIAYCNLHTLRDPAAFPSWLRGVVRHQCARELRRRRLALVPLEEGMGVPAVGLGPEQYAEQREGFQRVLAAMTALPEFQREVATLYYIKDYSQREIAAFLELPATTVNNRLHAARRRLRERLVAMNKQTGAVIGVQGPIVEVRFAPAETPLILSALALDGDEGRHAATLQVVQRLGDGMVRCLARGGAARLHIGAAVVNTGESATWPLDAPMVDEVMPLLGHLRGDAASDTGMEILETGIKAIDLLCPYPRGGNVGFLGPGGAGRLVTSAEVLRNVASDDAGVTIFAFVHGEADGAVWYGAPDEVPHPSGAGQLVCLPIEDTIDALSPAFRAASTRLDAVTYLSRDLGARGIWPAIDPLRSTSRLLTPEIVGQEHYEVARGVRALLRRYQELQLCTPQGQPPRLGDEEKTLIARARRMQRFLTQPFFVAEPFTQRPGQWVARGETVRACRDLLAGAYDRLPEEAFMWCGPIEQAVEKAHQMAEASPARQV